MRESLWRTKSFQTSQTSQLTMRHEFILQKYAVSNMIWCLAEDQHV